MLTKDMNIEIKGIYDSRFNEILTDDALNFLKKTPLPF